MRKLRYFVTIEDENDKKIEVEVTVTAEEFEVFKDDRKLVKSRLLCKMLYNVFTISTYQN